LDIARATVINIIEYCGADFVCNTESHDSWVMPNGEIIELETGVMRIPFEELEMIAELQLRIPTHEFDYLLGEFGVR